MKGNSDLQGHGKNTTKKSKAASVPMTKGHADASPSAKPAPTEDPWAQLNHTLVNLELVGLTRRYEAQMRRYKDLMKPDLLDVDLCRMSGVDPSVYRKVEATYFEHLRQEPVRFFDEAYQIHRKIWEKQGKLETPEFLRDVLSKGLLPLFDEWKTRFPDMKFRDINCVRNDLEIRIKIEAEYLELCRARLNSELLGKEQIEKTSEATQDSSNIAEPPGSASGKKVGTLSGMAPAGESKAESGEEELKVAQAASTQEQAEIIEAAPGHGGRKRDERIRDRNDLIVTLKNSYSHVRGISRDQKIAQALHEQGYRPRGKWGVTSFPDALKSSKSRERFHQMVSKAKSRTINP